MFSKADIEKYFIAEKNTGLALAIIAGVAIVTGILFLLLVKTNFYKGAAIPLIVMGLVAGIAGYTVYGKSDADRTRNVYAYDMNPGDLKSKELPRMEKVMQHFVWYKWAGGLLVLTGVVLFFYFRNDGANAFRKGFGAGLAVIAIIVFVTDYLAAARGVAYLNGLKEWMKK